MTNPHSPTSSSLFCWPAACEPRPTSSINCSTPAKSASARILLLMAEFGKPGAPKTFILPHYAGNTGRYDRYDPVRVSFFMNRFRKLGFINYNGRIQVHRSLLNVVLLE